MSTSATPSIWNAVEIAIRGANRSSAHSSTVSGSSPSNSTESSPASSSSISSTLMRAPRRRRLPAGGAGLRRRLAPLAERAYGETVSCRRLLANARPGRLEPRELAQLVIVQPPREVGERLAVEPRLEPTGDHPFDRRVELVGRYAPEERAADRGAGAEPAADEDVVGLPPNAAVVARRRALEAEVADPVLGARVRAPVEIQPQLGDLRSEALLEPLDQRAEPRL